VEILVALSLFLVVIGLGSLILVRTGKISVRGSVRASLQTRATLLMGKICTELQQTRADAVAVFKNEQMRGFGLTPIKGVTDRGSLLWASEAHVYCWQPVQGQLSRITYKPPSPDGLGSHPIPFSVSDVSAILGLADERTRVLDVGVNQFETTLANGQFKISLELREQGSLDDPQKYSLQRTLLLRNR
jgi:hypothetical protein